MKRIILAIFLFSLAIPCFADEDIQIASLFTNGELDLQFNSFIHSSSGMGYINLGLSFTGPTAGTYTVTPPSNCIVLTYNEYGIMTASVQPIFATGAANINLPELDIKGKARL
jgi:hypothetical protein